MKAKFNLIVGVISLLAWIVHIKYIMNSLDFWFFSLSIGGIINLLYFLVVNKMKEEGK